MSDERIKASAEAWESGKLGNDPKKFRKAKVDRAKIDKSLNLTLISLRLQDQLIDDLKHIAGSQGIGYQPLMRQILHMYVNSWKDEYASKPRPKRAGIKRLLGPFKRTAVVG